MVALPDTTYPYMVTRPVVVPAPGKASRYTNLQNLIRARVKDGSSAEACLGISFHGRALNNLYFVHLSQKRKGSFTKANDGRKMDASYAWFSDSNGVNSGDRLAH